MTENRSEKVKRWRKNTKKRMVESCGGLCCVCKKSYKDELFDFHHINPDNKEFGLGKIRGNCISWGKIITELRKCVMVCGNCHRLLHYCNEPLPKDINKFNEDYSNYSNNTSIKICEVCNKVQIPEHQKTCSRSCSAKISRTVDWDNIDVIELYNKYKNYNKIGDMLNISASSVRKRYLKIISIRQ